MPTTGSQAQRVFRKTLQKNLEGWKVAKSGVWVPGTRQVLTWSIEPGAVVECFGSDMSLYWRSYHDDSLRDMDEVRPLQRVISPDDANWIRDHNDGVRARMAPYEPSPTLNEISKQWVAERRGFGIDWTEFDDNPELFFLTSEDVESVANWVSGCASHWRAAFLSLLSQVQF